MRTIYLAPNITSFWMMNPGIILYYDKIYITKKDYDDIYEKKHYSSFHSYAYYFFNNLINKYPNIFTITEYHRDINKYDQQAISIIDFLFNEQSTVYFSPKKILDITTKKYLKWIKFNENKCLILSNEDEYRDVLQNQYIKKWKQYLKNINNLYKYVNHSDFYHRFKDNKSAIGSFTRLISRSLELIDFSKRKISTYDCMFKDYIDGINLAEYALHIINNKPYMGKISPLFSTKNKNIKLYNLISYTNIKSFFDNIEKYAYIRKKLYEIDTIINNLDNKDLYNAAYINKEIINILKQIKSKKVDYAIWIGCFFPILSYIFSPRIAEYAKNLVIDFYIHNKKYGDIFCPYIKLYGTMLKINDCQIPALSHCNTNKFNEKYDFYTNIINKRK